MMGIAWNNGTPTVAVSGLRIATWLSSMLYRHSLHSGEAMVMARANRAFVYLFAYPLKVRVRASVGLVAQE